MSGLRIRIPPRFAYDCMMGLLYHIQSPHRLRLEAGEVVIDGPRPANALKDALDTARQILENRMTTMAAVRERTRKPSTSFFERIPRSGNDRRPISALMGAYGLSWNTSAVDFVKTVSAKFATVSENIVLPSLLKPEYYEFNRGPGYIGEEMKKMRYEYPMLTVSLSLIGYLVCRMGRTLVGENDWVSVVVTPQTISHDRPLAIDQQYSLNTYVHSVSQLDRFLSMSRYLFAGIYPETALHLYLVMSMGGAKIRLYAVKEPGGQSPATIFSAMQMDLEPIYKALARYGLNNVKENIGRIVSTALSAREKTAAKSLAVRVAALLYEVLTGSKRVEEFVYTANREYIPWLMYGVPDRRDQSYQIAKNASRIATQLAG